MQTNDAVGGFERVLTLVPSCTLDADGRRSQQARYGTIAKSVSRVRRDPGVVFVDFAEDLDARLLQEVIAVERQCCRSLRFEFDEAARQLAVKPAEATLLPALDAIEAVFAAAVP